MSKIFVDQVDPKTATTLTLGTTGDTVDIPTGVGLSVTDEVKTNKISPATGTAFALGDSGDTFTVPSGATIVNSGTATGFGSTNDPSFKVHTSAATVTCVTATWTTLPYDTELFDSDGCFNTGTYGFTPTTEGYYFFYAGGYWSSETDFNGATLHFYKNTTDLSTGYGRNFNYNPAVASTIVHMNGSSDTMAVRVKQDSGGDLSFRSAVEQMGFGGFLVKAV
jgi:hypothetical protein